MNKCARVLTCERMESSAQAVRGMQQRGRNDPGQGGLTFHQVTLGLVREGFPEMGCKGRLFEM